MSKLDQKVRDKFYDQNEDVIIDVAVKAKKASSVLNEVLEAVKNEIKTINTLYQELNEAVESSDEGAVKRAVSSIKAYLFTSDCDEDCEHCEGKATFTKSKVARVKAATKKVRSVRKGIAK